MKRNDIVAKLRSYSPTDSLGEDNILLSKGSSAPLAEAAVLVPLIDREEGLTILLTRRTDHLRDHAGQISFPGGRKDKSDENAIATALREAEEEIGLNRDHVEVVTELAPYTTGTGFIVTPIVALIHPSARFLPDPFEVAEIFEVPLSFLLAPESRQRVSRLIADQVRLFYAFTWQRYYIWGATAGMLVNLLDRLTQNKETS